MSTQITTTYCRLNRKMRKRATWSNLKLLWRWRKENTLSKLCSVKAVIIKIYSSIFHPPLSSRLPHKRTETGWKTAVARTLDLSKVHSGAASPATWILWKLSTPWWTTHLTIHLISLPSWNLEAPYTHLSDSPLASISTSLARWSVAFIRISTME